MPNRVELTKEQIQDYVRTAHTYPFVNVDQLVSMVILHFDIPDRQAKQVVEEILSTMREVNNGRKR